MWAFMSGFCHVGTCINFVIIVLKVIRKKPSWLRPQPLRGCPRGDAGDETLGAGKLGLVPAWPGMGDIGSQKGAAQRKWIISSHKPGAH